ncbi:hypothetical protein GQ53DRAFT_844413 [Thozetella sp. PMI_491]|nr:hypothetical protein GQ53DRAFT_844413 [Thozetella sp. PMI_491]
MGTYETPRERLPRPHARRSWLVISALFTLLGLLSCLRWYGALPFGIWASNELFDVAPLVDGHNDFPIWIRAFYQNHIYQRNFTEAPELYGQVDFPRLRQGRLRGQFWSVYVECPKVETSPDEVNFEIVHDTLQQIDLVYRLIQQNSADLEHVHTASQIWRTFKSGQKIASLMGIEGLHQIGDSASILRMYHAMGVRYATLTHTCHNAYADSEAPDAPRYGGLSEAGRAIVREMNRLGMIVDLSHTSFATQRDVLKISAAPVMFSHSNAYGRCNHTRNVPDDVLQEVKKNDGIVMVTFYPLFLEADPATASLQSVVEHIQYIGAAIGYRHVGIGSDFDGMPGGPRGLEDVSKYPSLVGALQHAGVERSDILGVMGLNIIRVLEAVERVASSMGDVRPLEDNVKPLFD